MRWSTFFGGLLVLFVAIQFVPRGRDHTNPPITGSPKWDAPRTEELVRRACFDCHSNETKWPFYASIAPVSWLIQDDVTKGRSHLNFSEFDKKQRNADAAAKEVRDKEMPLEIYIPLHPAARLTDSERTELSAGLRRMFGDEERHGAGESLEDDSYK